MTERQIHWRMMLAAGAFWFCIFAAAAAFAAEKSRLFVNTSWPIYYAPGCPTINAIKTAERFGLPGDRNRPAPVDADGYPTADFGVMVHADVPGITGTYTLSWIGTGQPAAAYGSTVKFANVRRTLDGRTVADCQHTGNLLAFKVTGTANGARDLKLLRPGYSDDAKVFTDAYLASKEPFGGVRLMDWLQTNTTTVRAWDDRCKVTDAQWSNPSKGGPIEPWLDWAEATGKDVYINIPHLTDDRYVQELAKLCAEKLANAPNANVWIEHSNEVWNAGMFPQGKWILPVAQAAGIPRMAYHAKRTVEIGRAFRQHFPASRTRLIYAVQFAAFAEGEAGLKWAMQRYPDHGIYGVAVAPYMGESGNPTTATVPAQADFLLSTAKRWATGDSESVKGLTNIRVKLDALGLKLVDYEGGITNALGGTAQLIAARKAAQETPQAGEATAIYLDVIFARGVHTHVYFNDFSQYVKSGYWGLSNSPRIDTPKFKAAALAAAKYTSGIDIEDDPPAKPAAPAWLTVQNEGTRLRITWAPVAVKDGYYVRRDGLRLTAGEFDSTDEQAWVPGEPKGLYTVTAVKGGKESAAAEYRYPAVDPNEAKRARVAAIDARRVVLAAEIKSRADEDAALVAERARIVEELGE